MISRRNRFQGAGSKVPELVPKPGTRNRFLNIVSLMHCITCVLYESLFVNNESRDIGLKLMRLRFHIFIHSFIRCIYQQPNITFGASSKNQFNKHEFKKKKIEYNQIRVTRFQQPGTRFLNRVISQFTTLNRY